ncbi:MAG: WhiB family transcriptional regulator [Candidatus Ancillula sp.]|nr:WhiB family transcriptional regulator [Candidatus Ancillula sp.]
MKFRDKVGSLFDVAEADKGLSWQYEALCSQTDPEAFFPEKGGVTRDRDAKRVCNVCPVQGECLEWALKNDERFGIWGGKSERERRALKAVRLSSSGKMSAKSGLKRANGFGR